MQYCSFKMKTFQILPTQEVEQPTELILTIPTQLQLIAHLKNKYHDNRKFKLYYITQVGLCMDMAVRLRWYILWQAYSVICQLKMSFSTYLQVLINFKFYFENFHSIFLSILETIDFNCWRSFEKSKVLDQRWQSTGISVTQTPTFSAYSLKSFYSHISLLKSTWMKNKSCMC